MRERISRATALAVLATAASVPALLAQEAQPVAAPPRIELSGEGLTALTLTRESLAAVDVIKPDVTLQTSDGEQRGL